MASTLVTVQLSKTIEVELYLEHSENGFYLQNPETELWMSAWPDYKHMYWSSKKDDNQLFTVDLENENKLITYHGTYVSDNFNNEMLWQIWPGYEDECFAVRIVDYSPELKESTTEEVLMDAFEQELEQELEAQLVENEDEITDDSITPIPTPEISIPVVVEENTSEDNDTNSTTSSEQKAPAPAALALKKFLEVKRDEFKTKHPEMKKGDLTKEMKRAWKEDMSKEEKKTYYPAK